MPAAKKDIGEQAFNEQLEGFEREAAKFRPGQFWITFDGRFVIRTSKRGESILCEIIAEDGNTKMLSDSRNYCLDTILRCYGKIRIPTKKEFAAFRRKMLAAVKAEKKALLIIQSNQGETGDDLDNDERTSLETETRRMVSN